jgi:GcrA cell cycle regulator
MAAIQRWLQQDIAKVAAMLVAGETVKNIGSHFNVSKGSIASVMVRHDLAGLSKNRFVAKIEPPPAIPQRQHKFIATAFKSNPTLPTNSLRNLPAERSPCAKCWSDFNPKTDCHWPINDEPFLFCGRTKSGKRSSYCKAHLVRSLASRQSRASNSDRDSRLDGYCPTTNPPSGWISA